MIDRSYDWACIAEWADDHANLVYGWGAQTWEGSVDLSPRQTSMHMIPLVPAWRVIELEDEVAALKAAVQCL